MAFLIVVFISVHALREVRSKTVTISDFSLQFRALPRCNRGCQALGALSPGICWLSMWIISESQCAGKS